MGVTVGKAVSFYVKRGKFYGGAGLNALHMLAWNGSVKICALGSGKDSGPIGALRENIVSC